METEVGSEWMREKQDSVNEQQAVIILG